MGSSTENSAFGPTRNPVAPDRVPGGSSGGSAAAVAAGIVPIALGSETGGSVRQPAAFCGVVGVKPTYGRVSRFGLVAFASSLDHVGVFGATVDDAALALQHHRRPRPARFDERGAAGRRLSRRERTRRCTGSSIGRPTEYFPADLDRGVRERCDAAIDRLRALGAEVRDVSLPHTDLAIPVYYIIAPAEASSNLARFDGVRYGLRLRATACAGCTRRRARTDSAPKSRGAFSSARTCSPPATTTRTTARRSRCARSSRRTSRACSRRRARAVHAHDADAGVQLGAKSDPYEMYLSDIFTCTANLAGVPAMSLPIGRVDGLPVGGQLIAAHFDESRMFARRVRARARAGRRGATMSAGVGELRLRDGRGPRGARAAQDGDEDLLPLLDGLRRAAESPTRVRCASACRARCRC